jgi:hypothetical protein
LKEKLQKNVWGTLTAAFLDFTVQSLDLLNLVDHNSLFLNQNYPTTVNEVFKNIPIENLLEIYSPLDFIAPPESCLRFAEHMQMRCIHEYGHQEIIQKDTVIQIILEFLSNQAKKQE